MTSKSTLRAVAAEITRDDDTLYFPSYEMVMYSNPRIAWKGDRRHVTKEMVGHVIRTFKSAHGMGTAVRGVALVDLDRRRIEANADDGFAINGDEVFLHPGSADQEPASVIFRNLPGDALAGFRSRTQVARREAKPIRFTVVARRSGSLEELARGDVITTFEAVGSLNVDLSQVDADKIDVVLSTEMAEPTDGADFAWAQFLSPTILYH